MPTTAVMRAALCPQSLIFPESAWRSSTSRLAHATNMLGKDVQHTESADAGSLSKPDWLPSDPRARRASCTFLASSNSEVWLIASQVPCMQVMKRALRYWIVVAENLLQELVVPHHSTVSQQSVAIGVLVFHVSATTINASDTSCITLDIRMYQRDAKAILSDRVIVIVAHRASMH